MKFKSNSSPVEVELDKHIPAGTEYLVGRLEGQEFIERLNRAKILLPTETPTVVKFPERIVTANGGFFLGMFQNHINLLRERFLDVYKFEGRPRLVELIRTQYVKDGMSGTMSREKLAKITALK